MHCFCLQGRGLLGRQTEVSTAEMREDAGYGNDCSAVLVDHSRKEGFYGVEMGEKVDAEGSVLMLVKI